jgi:hypothetical protein
VRLSTGSPLARAFPTLSALDAAIWAAGVVVGVAAVAAGPGWAKTVAGLAAAVAATNALIEVSRASRLQREPPAAVPAWWRQRELTAKTRARLWTLLAGALTLAALARDDGADAVHGAAIAAGVVLVALGALTLVALSDARSQHERMLAFLPNRAAGALGTVVLAGGLFALIWGSL